jgi:hypothetical protein
LVGEQLIELAWSPSNQTENTTFAPDWRRMTIGRRR